MEISKVARPLRQNRLGKKPARETSHKEPKHKPDASTTLTGLCLINRLTLCETRLKCIDSMPKSPVQYLRIYTIIVYLRVNDHDPGAIISTK